MSSSSTKAANQEKHARSVAQPQRPAPPGPLKPTRARRRPALIALGLALVALSVLASVYVTSMLGETQRVLAITATVPRGTEIESSHVGVVELPTGPSSLKSLPAAQFDQIVDQGKVATADLKAGQLLTSDSFADELQPAAGRSIVGIALAPNQMPGTQGLKAGDAVRVVETPATGGEPPTEAPFAISATVLGVSDPTLADQRVVDVEVASNNAAALAARAATGRVAIVIDAVGAG